MTAQTHVLQCKSILVCLLVALSQNDGSGRSQRVSAASAASSNGSTALRELAAGVTVTDAISAGNTRAYAFSLSAGQHGSIEVKKRDLQIKVSLCGLERQSCVQMINRRYGTLDLSFSAEIATTYTVEVTSLEKDKAERSYEIRLSEIVKTTPKHHLSDRAGVVIAEAEQLREVQDRSSQLAAIAKYTDASRLWQSAGEFRKAVETLCNMGDVYFVLSQYRESLAQYVNAHSISERNSDQIGTLNTLNGIAYANVYLGENEKALSHANQVLAIVERVKSDEFKRAEAQALNTIGEVYYAQGELRKSIEMFERAYPLYSQIGERAGQALALLNLGYSHSDLGDSQKASEHYERALTQFQSVSNMHGSTLAQTALGGFYSLAGEEDKALNLHNAASEYFRRMGNKQGEAAALNGVARAYQDLNDYDSALDNYDKALKLNEAIGHRGNTALGKFLVARVFYQKGEIERAVKYYNESLELSRQVADAVVEAHALKGLGTIYFSRGDVTGAVAQYDSALQIYRMRGNRRSEAYVLNDMAHIQTRSRNLPEALAKLEQALPLMQATGDRHGEALTLFNTAKVELERGNLPTALTLIEKSIAIGESLRTKIVNFQLRTSYFATVSEQYELYIDTLMRLHAQQPNKGYAVAALLASERGRARMLLDSLLEEKIESHDKSSADLMSQLQNVLGTLNEKAEQQMRLLAGNHTQQEVEKLSQDIHELTIQYQDIRSKMRVESPRRAAWFQPDQLKAEDLQNLVKGDDALLLEFALGNDRSYVWAVSDKEIVSHELPPRAEIEAIAQKLYESITLRQSAAGDLKPGEQEKLVSEADAEYRRQSAVLSNVLLGPIGSRLAVKRILIVGDGLLHFIPFDALPLPESAPAQGSRSGGDAQLLVSGHDIVILPSALTLVAMRDEPGSIESKSRTIAVIADPVFEKDDPRVMLDQASTAPTTSQNSSAYFSSALRDFNQTGKPSRISRLPSTLREAKVISDLAPSNEVVTTTGFAASKHRFINERVKNYRVVHIATHGLLNVKHPHLSGLIFSLFDEQGENVDGFLRLHDIYNLDLPADLVVLSACRTGLGKDVQGEGIVGLSTGFIYAGAKTVVSSLWKVDDTATAEFMSYFYSALLKDMLPPAVALRNAKLEMQKQERWRAPFYWAGFVLQGEYTNSVVVQKTSNGRRLMIFAAVVLVMGSIYAIARYKRRNSRL